MRTIKILIFVAITGLLLSSCQKASDIAGGPAAGTLKYSSNGDCMPISVNGLFAGNVRCTDANYADIQLNITNIGTYNITSDTVNGFSFHGAGYAGITGINSIRLTAAGKPILPEVDVFKVRFGNSVCEINIPVVLTNPAVYTFGTSGTTCTGAVVSGNYIPGITTDGSDFVTINVTVTTPGAYNIITDRVNGVQFSAAGFFATAGTFPVILKSNGTPPSATVPGAALYTISQINGGTGTCSFTVNYLGPASYTVNCGGISSTGTYRVNTPLNSSNIVTVPVTATGPGYYSINTDTQNGVSFSGNGVFTSGGPQNIIIKGTGTASAPPGSGSTDFYHFIYPGGSCNFQIDYATPLINGYLTCDINGGASTVAFNENLGMSYSGSTLSTAIFEATIAGWRFTQTNSPKLFVTLKTPFTGPGFEIGTTYDVNQYAAGITVDIKYYIGTAIYSAVTDPANQAVNPPFTITITDLTSTRLTGVFSGPLKNAAGSVVNITNGAFSLPR